MRECGARRFSLSSLALLSKLAPQRATERTQRKVQRMNPWPDLRSELDQRRIDFLTADVKICFTFAKLAATELKIGDREAAARAIGHAEQKLRNDQPLSHRPQARRSLNCRANPTLCGGTPPTPAGIRLRKNLVVSGLIGGIGDPAAVGRESRRAFVEFRLDDGARLRKLDVRPTDLRAAQEQWVPDYY